MSELTSAMKTELLNRMREHVPSVEYSNQGWREVSVEFQDSCGCYSEYTTEPCCLNVAVCVDMPSTEDEQADLRQTLDDVVERWAKANLAWSGCDCCDNSLSVWVRVFNKAKESAKR